MLNTLLDKVSSFFSKSFVVASLFPLMIVAAANGLILYAVSPGSRKWLELHTPTKLTDQAAETGTIIGILIIASFVLSSASGKLRDVLEGKHWSSSVARWLAIPHREALDRLITSIEINNRERGEWADFVDERDSLIAQARSTGRGTGATQYTSMPSNIGPVFRRAWKCSVLGQPIAMADASTLRGALVDAYTAIDDQIASPALEALDDDWMLFKRLCDYEVNRLDALATELLNEKQFGYGLDVVAPTAFGNVGRSMCGYASQRYGINLDVFWSRLQKVLLEKSTGKDSFFGTIQDAKAQLDFYVSTFMLLTATLAVWIVLMPFLADSIALYLTVTVAAPCVVIPMYRGCVVSYRAFAEMIRAATDLYRFDLLKGLRIAPPRTLEQEQVVWDELNQLSGYGLAQQSIRYEHSQ